MIITCPSCSTSYDIDAAALGATGKSVRCASCGDKWHQAPEEAQMAAQPAPPPPSQPEAATPPPPPPPSEPEPAPPPPEAPAPESEPDPEPDPEPEPEPAASDESLELPSDEELDEALGPESDAEVPSYAPESDDDVTELDEEDLENLPDPEPIESFVPGEDDDSEFDDEDLDPDDIPDPDPIPDILSDPDSDLDDEPRSRKGLWISLAAAVVILIGIGGGGYTGRYAIAEMWPTTLALYDMLGVHVEFPGEGLEIRRPTLARDRDEDGKDVIIVRGIIANVSNQMRMVPLIEVALLDDIDQKVQSVRMPPLKSSLQPKEEIGFRARLDDVPTARRLEVTFAKEDAESEMPAAEK